MLKRKDVLIIALVVLLAGGLLLLSRQMGTGNGAPTGGQLPAETAAHAGASATPASAQGDIPQALPTLAPAEAYLSVQIGQVVYDPIPLLEENTLELVQSDGKRNVVAFTPGSIVMHASNCDNQDCVHQGKVTLDNRDQRVLMNMIICLPNQVVLSLLDAREAQKQWLEMYPNH